MDLMNLNSFADFNHPCMHKIPIILSAVSVERLGDSDHLVVLDTNLRKDNSIARPFGDDPFALDGFGDCKNSSCYRCSSSDHFFSSCRTCICHWYW